MVQLNWLRDAPTKPLAVQVAFPAEVDITRSEVVGAALLAAFQPGVSIVIADMSATEFCDSAAIRHLIIANNQAACTGAELRVVIPSPAVRRTLHIAGADQTLQVYADVDAALTAPSQP